MLHMMIEKGERIDAILFFDGGWEFQEILDHIAQVEKKTGRPITTIYPPPHKKFDYLLIDHRAKRSAKNETKMLSYGWPSRGRRWCTREKARQIDHWIKENLQDYKSVVRCLGIAADEPNRITYGGNYYRYTIRYPLVKWSVTERQALEYCFSLGYDFGGLYDHFTRASCYCCPLQGEKSLKILRRNFPNLWRIMLKKDRQIINNIGFLRYETVQDLEKRFAKEEIAENAQLSLFK